MRVASRRLTLAPGTGSLFGISAGGAVGRVQGNPIPYVLPWLTATFLFGVAMLVRFTVAGDVFAWLWAPLVFVMYAAITYGAWRASRPRGEWVSILATTGVGVASAWGMVLSGLPHLTWRPVEVYGLCAFAVCFSANLYCVFRHEPGEGQTMHDKVDGAIGKVRNISEIETMGGQVTAKYTMQPGVPATELQGDAQRLASLHHVPPNGVRVVTSRTDAAVAKVTFTPVDALAQSVPYPGPSLRNGGTILDPIVVGLRAGRAPLRFWLPGDPAQSRNASLIALTGMTGAAKTTFTRYTLIELLSRGMPDEVEYWYLNARKAHQEPDWVRNGAARFESTRKGVVDALRDLRDEVPLRSAHLGARELDEWAPGCGIPFRLVVLDEFAVVASDIESLFVDLAESVRSTGVVLMPGFQRASGDRFPTSARAQFGTHICFGVDSDTDAAMALPEDVLDAGASPWLWQNEQPGMCYLCAPGVPHDEWTEPGRIWKPNRELMARWAEHYIALRSGAAQPVDDDQAARMQAVLDDPELARYAEGLARELADDEDVEGEDMGIVTDIDGDVEVVDLDEFDEREAAADAEESLREVADDIGDGDLDEFDDELPDRPVVPEDCGEALDLDPFEKIDPGVGGGMPLGLSPQMSSADARAHVRAYLAGLKAQGVARFKMEDMAGDLLADVGYRASWLRKVLGEFCTEQPVWLRKTDERGWYDVLGEPTRAIGGDTP